MPKVSWQLSLVVTIVLAVVSGCGASSRATGKPGVLNIGVNPYPGNAPLYVAAGMGLCDEHGVRLNLVNNNDPSLLDAELRSGAVDVAAFTNNTLLRDAASGIDIKAFLTMDFSVGGDGVVSQDSKVRTIADLARTHTTVAADEGDTAYFLLMTAAARQNLAPSDFNVSQMNTDAATGAFLSGRVPAAGLFQPALDQAVRRPGAHMVVSSAQYPGAISDIFVARSTVAETRRRDLRTFADCWYRGLQLLHSSARAREIAAKALGVTSQDLVMLESTVRWPDRQAGARYLAGGALLSTIEFSAKLYRRLGLLDSAPDGRTLIDTQVVGGR